MIESKFCLHVRLKAGDFSVARRCTLFLLQSEKFVIELLAKQFASAKPAHTSL